MLALFAGGVLAVGPVAAEVKCDGKVVNLFEDVPANTPYHVAFTVPNKKKFLLTQFCNNDEGSSAPDFLIKAPGYDGNTLPDVGDGAKDSGSEFVPGILYPPGSKVVVQNSSDAEHPVLINGCLVKKSFHFKKFKYLTWPRQRPATLAVRVVAPTAGVLAG